MADPEIFPVKRKYSFSLYDQNRLVLKSKTEGYSDARICREFGIASSTFSNYKFKIDLTLDYPKDQFTFHEGRKSLGYHIEPILDKFIEEMEDGMAECSVESLALLANSLDMEIYQKIFSIRRKTHVAQKPCDIPTCMDFVMHVNEIVHDYNIDVRYVINMDETPCYNDNRPTTKVVSKGAMNVNGAKTRTGDYRTTIMLACAANGHKLKPMIIFKALRGKTIEKNLTFQNGYPRKNENNQTVDAAAYCCQKKAWVDERTMLQWIQKVKVYE